jgi:hypothetical protein
VTFVQFGEIGQQIFCDNRRKCEIQVPIILYFLLSQIIRCSRVEQG